MTSDSEQLEWHKGTGRAAAGYFAVILIGSLLAAFLGGGFGALVASVSPEFVKNLFSLKPADGSAVRYSFSVGMIWGLFLGVAVSAFACLLTAVVRMIRLRIEHRSGEKA